MIKFRGETKMTANEFAKNFIMSSIDKITENMDVVFDANPEWYGDLTDKERTDIKAQMKKRADGVRGYYGLNKGRNDVE